MKAKKSEIIRARYAGTDAVTGESYPTGVSIIYNETAKGWTVVNPTPYTVVKNTYSLLTPAHAERGYERKLTVETRPLNERMKLIVANHLGDRLTEDMEFVRYINKGLVVNKRNVIMEVVLVRNRVTGAQFAVGYDGKVYVGTGEQVKIQRDVYDHVQVCEDDLWLYEAVMTDPETYHFLKYGEV